MKILVVNNFYHPYEVGGAEESLRLQCEALVELGQKVDVLTVAHDSSCSGTRVQNGVTIRYFESFFSKGSPLQNHRQILNRIGWQFGGIFQFGIALRSLRLMREQRYDIIYVNNLPGIGRSSVLIAKALNIPVVAGLRDYAWICLRQSRFQRGENCTTTCLKCKLGCALRKRISAHVSGVAANSVALLSAFKESRTFTGIDSSVIYAGAGKSIDAQLDSAPPRRADGNLTIGVMGQIQPSKGFELFLNEISPVVAENGVHVLIAGTIATGFAIALRDRFSSTNITFPGRLDRSDFFSRVDVVVIPSIWNEPLSRITYEALAHTKCVIASSNGGQKEIIVHGSNGYIYTPGDGSLEAIISRLQQHPDLILQQERGAAESSSKYTPARAASSLLELFESVVKKE